LAKKVERETKELQDLVYGNRRRGSVAKSLYPAHDSSVRQFEIVRRDAPQRSIAGRIYPNLRER